MSTDLTLPMLALCRNIEQFDDFREKSGFLPTELKRVSAYKDVLGHKDTVLFLLAYSNDMNEIRSYCNQHNIRLVQS